MGLASRRSCEIAKDQMPLIMPNEFSNLKLTAAFLRPAYQGTPLEYLSSQFKEAHNID